MKDHLLSRRRLLGVGAAAAGGVLLSGCDRLSGSPTFQTFIGHGEDLSFEAQRLLLRGQPLAREFKPSEVSRIFRANGTSNPDNDEYNALLKDGFAHWRLAIDGLVARPASFSLADLRAMPARSQITRHDCVEGWSAIGKWRGVPLGDVIARARPTSAARFAIFSCYDRDEEGSHYYESLDLVQAAHPQTLLALDLNDAQLDPAHGAPVRLRIPTQLGYKSAKWVHRIQLAANFTDPGLGKGGYWEDQGYEWYAGI